MIADGKRGDIADSARAYEQAVFGGIATPFGPSHGLGADAVTQNPLLGRDALAPFVDGAARRGTGVFVLVRTSNPGAADLFDAELADGGALWERIARLVAEAGHARPGVRPRRGRRRHRARPQPQHLARMRELMPHDAVPAARASARRAVRSRTSRRRSDPGARPAW